MSDTKNINPAEKPLTSVMEDYLEAIYDLEKDHKVVRVRDIAKKMDVKMPSVTSMLKTLNGRNLVHYEKYEYVELTNQGANIGREMRQRHEIIRKFLTEILQIDFKTADEDACKIEHTLSPLTLDSLTDFIEFIQTYPMGGELFKHFEEYRSRKSVKN
jgi:DtxR family Mn-dependent transcriptional regulator